MTKPGHSRPIPAQYAAWHDLDARAAMYADQEIASCQKTVEGIADQGDAVDSAWSAGMLKQLSVRLHAANLVKEALNFRYD